VRQDERVISALKLRMHLLWWAPVVTAFAAVSLVLFVLTVAGSALIVVWVGIPLLLAALAAARPLAQFYRRRLTYLDGKGVIDSPYLTSPHGNLLAPGRRLAPGQRHGRTRARHHRHRRERP
jgi:hypothetical protein